MLSGNAINYHQVRCVILKEMEVTEWELSLRDQNQGGWKVFSLVPCKSLKMPLIICVLNKPDVLLSTV